MNAMNMGSVSSSSESDVDNAHADYRESDVPNEVENDYVLERDNAPVLDLQGLFDPGSLRAAAAKVKDDLPENPVQQHHGHILRWLEERSQRGEETITLGQFCDVLQSKSVNKEDAIKAFAQFDSEGDGTADVSATIDALRTSNGANLSSELTYVVRKLQACSLTPGFIDVYTENKQVLGQHGLRVLNFILRNRAPSSSLPFHILSGFNNTMTMRLTVLNSHLGKLKENAHKQQEESLLNLGEELKPITKCFKGLEVSTNTADAYRLTNGDSQSYWQSDGSARSHWIRLRMRSGVVIKQMHVAVNASDQSYMPQLISVSVGNSVHSLHEIKEVRIPSHVTGDVLVLENCKSYYPVIQINIKRCHSDGCDTRIHGIKTLGYRVVKEAGVSVMDASAAWYLQVLATTATVCIPFAPHIRGMIRQHTKDALRHMGPLSLSPASGEKPQFMTSHVLTQMDSFLHDIASDADTDLTPPWGKNVAAPDVATPLNSKAISPDGLFLLIEFNLARGHVAGIGRAMQVLVENPGMQLEAGSLMRRMRDVRDAFWRKQCSMLQLTLAGCDGGSKDESSGAKNVLSSNWSTSTPTPYVSAEGRTKVNMFFRSHDLVQLTKLRIKVDKGKLRPRGGMVFVYRDSKSFELQDHVTRFSGYDEWSQTEYSFCQSVRANGYGGKPDNPVAFFTFDDDWDEIEVPLDVCPIGQYVLVKFLPPLNPDSEKISVVGIKFHGFARKAIFLPAEEDQPEPYKPEPRPGKNSNNTEGNKKINVAEAARGSDTRVRTNSNTSGTEVPKENVAPSYGLESTSEQHMTTDPSSPATLETLSRLNSTSDVVSGDRVLHSILEFLVSMARDQVVDKRQPAAARPPSLDMQGLNINLIWSLYQSLSDTSCQILCLQLLHALFPFLASDKDAIKDGAEELFKHLCHLVDNNNDGQSTARQGENENEAKIKQRLIGTARQVIIDGAAVFFSDKEARRKQLFHMMDGVNSKAENPSLLLTFQSLCQFFSTVDPSGLLDLPHHGTGAKGSLTAEGPGFDSQAVLAVMETLISVAHKETRNVLDSGELTEQSSHLVNLLCSLQTSLLSWCQQQTTGATVTPPSPTAGSNNQQNNANSSQPQSSVAGGNNRLCEEAQTLLVQFVELVSREARDALQELEDKTDTQLDTLIKNLEGSFLATGVRQMVLILTALGDSMSSTQRVALMTSLMHIARALRRLSGRMPNVFHGIGSDHWKGLDSGEETLRTWEVESPHNYENNQHITQVFNCPGSSHFIVEFDPRCETEKRYDYLEFTDSNGLKLKFEQKVGTDKWQSQVTFRGGHRLHFLFHSDSSNNEWGYKFKVIAKGSPDEPLSWIYDLQLCLAKLFGRLGGATLDSSVLIPLAANSQDANHVPNGDSENDLLKSDLWTTLFRGGYRVGKLQRSLSGKHVASEDSLVCEFLLILQEPEVQGQETEAKKQEFQEERQEVKEVKPQVVAEFLKRCREQYVGPSIGDDEVSNAANALMAALIWHSQPLREDLERYIKNEGECKLYEGLAQAFNTAQGQRAHLVDQRQKFKVNLEKDPKTKMADPVKSCQQKSEFLLKFSGLAKVDIRRDNTRNNKLRKQTSRQHRLSNYALDKNLKLDSILEKHPAFRLVLEFVKDPAWSMEKVQELLKARSLQAHAVAEVYMFVAEYLRIMTDSHLFQIPNVLLIQELLGYQTKFSKHYADGLDGCGLDLEGRVRRSYYTLLRRLIDALRSTNRNQLEKTVMAAYDYIQACTLHFLDINWQQYDLAFLVDIKLPEFYLGLAKNSVAVRQQLVGTVDEEQEMRIYTTDMEMLKECKESFLEWYNKAADKLTSDEKMAKQMFVAKFCDLLDVEISCDGCAVTLPGRRYRCLQCEDMDLCATCYAGGVKPRVGNHTDEHDIIHMMFKCDQCKAFITATRIHCNQCEDFDLCLGCHKVGTFPAGHDTSHEVTQCPVVKLKMNKDWDTSLQAYIHQHVWLAFSSVALSMANLIYNSSVRANVDTDYTKACTQLHNQCIKLAISCLMKVNVGDDPMADVESEEYKQRRREEAFAVHSQERIMGLLAAMIPPLDHPAALTEDVSFTFSSKTFLHLLLSIARGERGHEPNTQHLAMGLLGQLLHGPAMSCAVADAAIRLGEGTGAMMLRLKSEKSDTEGEISTDEMPEEGNDGVLAGEATAKYLFSFGAACLERSGLEWANSVAGILQKLFTCHRWKEVLLRYLSKTIRGLKGICSADTVTTHAPSSDTLSNDVTRVFEELSADDAGGAYVIKDVALSYAREMVQDANASDSVQEARLEGLWKKHDAKGTGRLTREVFVEFAREARGCSGGEPPLASIFALFVLAGFPEVLSIGCQVKYTDVGTERRDGVVLKHFPEKDQTLIVDSRNRKRCTVKDEYVECDPLETPALEQQLVSVFIDVISDVTEKLKAVNTAVPAGPRQSVESVWVLALSLKALLRTLRTTGGAAPLPDLFRTGFVRCVVHLASQSTGFSKQWLLKDLEILSLMLYTREREEEPGAEQQSSPGNKEGGGTQAAAEETPPGASDAGNPWTGLDDTTKICFQTLQDHLNIPASVLRAIYDMNGRSTNALLVAVHENVQGESYVASEDVKQRAKKWEQSAQRTAQEVLSEKAMDTGMQVVLLLKQEKRSYDNATEEATEEAQRLIDAGEEDALYGDAQKQRRTRSSALLKKQLDTQGKTRSRDYLVKVNTALAVLYGRQMLLTLLGDWPAQGPPITTDLLGCAESAHLPFVLDLLNKSESKEAFQKVVENVIRHCDPSCLGPLAQVAAQFMEEVNLSTVVKESEHNYKNNTNYETKIHIPGATSLSVRFDSRCCTEEECDELVLSSSEDYQRDRKVFSGPRARWNDFDMPGDTVYMKFTSDCSSNDWGYRFTVTGGKMGRFDTGYLILNSVLSLRDCILRLPIEDLWATLVYVCCKQTGQQRLRSIQLLLKILQSQFKRESCSQLGVDLSLLLPLWKLYNKMPDASDGDSPTVVSPLCRALTELFFVAENLALDWERVREYLWSLMLPEEARDLMVQGMRNVAAISLAIGYKNQVTAAVQGETGSDETRGVKATEDVMVKL